MTEEDDELDLEDEEESKGKPKPSSKPSPPSKEDKEASIGKPIAPATGLPPEIAGIPGITGSTIGAQLTPPDVGQSPLPTSAPPQGAVGSPIAVTQPPARPSSSITPLPHYHGLNRVLDTLGGATNIGTAIERASGLGTQGALVNRQREEAAQMSQATVENVEAEAEQRRAMAAREEALAGNVGKTVTVQGPNGPVDVPVATWEKLEQERMKQEGANKRTTETVGSRENIAKWSNDTRTRIATLGDQVRKDVANIGAAAGIKKAEIGANARVESAKVGAGKISPFIASEAKVYQDSYERLRTMQQNLDDALRDPQHPDQQAMLSLLAQHMGMTLGAIKGTRAGRQLIQEAEASAPFLGRIEAHFSDDGYLTGVVLTPEQMQSMVSLAENRFKLDQERFHNMQQFASQGGQGELNLGTPSGGGTSHFVEGDKAWDIPPDKIDGFKQKHPNARQQ